MAEGQSEDLHRPSFTWTNREKGSTKHFRVIELSTVRRSWRADTAPGWRDDHLGRVRDHRVLGRVPEGSRVRWSVRSHQAQGVLRQTERPCQTLPGSSCPQGGPGAGGERAQRSTCKLAVVLDRLVPPRRGHLQVQPCLEVGGARPRDDATPECCPDGPEGVLDAIPAFFPGSLGHTSDLEYGYPTGEFPHPVPKLVFLEPRGEPVLLPSEFLQAVLGGPAASIAEQAESALSVTSDRPEPLKLPLGRWFIPPGPTKVPGEGCEVLEVISLNTWGHRQD